MQQLRCASGESPVMRMAVAGFGLLMLGGCAAEAPLKEEPAFYLSMAHGGAKVDPGVAASMISGYRQNNGLGAVAGDPELVKLAEAQSIDRKSTRLNSSHVS